MGTSLILFLMCMGLLAVFLFKFLGTSYSKFLSLFWIITHWFGKGMDVLVIRESNYGLVSKAQCQCICWHCQVHSKLRLLIGFSSARLLIALCSKVVGSVPC